MRRRGGQVSIEYLTITAFSLLLLVPLLLMFYAQSDTVRADLIEAQARGAGEALVKAAERVYYAGPPTRETVQIRFPDGVTNVHITSSIDGLQSSIILTLNIPYEYEMLIPAHVPILQIGAGSTLGPTRGPVLVEVEATSTGVRLTEQ